MIQAMHRSENWAYPLYFPFISQGTAQQTNPKVVTVTVTDIFGTHDTVMFLYT